MIDITMADIIPPIIDVGQKCQYVCRTAADIQNIHSLHWTNKLLSKILPYTISIHEYLGCGI
jgi:hypothetical protein